MACWILVFQVSSLLWALDICVPEERKTESCGFCRITWYVHTQKGFLLDLYLSLSMYYILWAMCVLLCLLQSNHAEILLFLFFIFAIHNLIFFLVYNGWCESSEQACCIKQMEFKTVYCQFGEVLHKPSLHGYLYSHVFFWWPNQKNYSHDLDGHKIYLLLAKLGSCSSSEVLSSWQLEWHFYLSLVFDPNFSFDLLCFLMLAIQVWKS